MFMMLAGGMKKISVACLRLRGNLYLFTSVVDRKTLRKIRSTRINPLETPRREKKRL